MKMLFRKTILFALVLVLGLAAMPFVSASAAGEYDPTPPPAEQGQIRTERLERAWARQLRIYERMGRTDEFIEKVQKLIDRAKANGKDVSAVQPRWMRSKRLLKTHSPFMKASKALLTRIRDLITMAK